jgi:signal transduction histidine kinase
MIAASVVIITALHYLTGISQLPYHSIYRSLYYLPIVGAAVYYGWRGGIFIALVGYILFLPRSLVFGEVHPGELFDNVLELPVFVLVGGMGGLLAQRERQQRQRADMLRAYLDSVMHSLPLGVVTVDDATGQTIPRNATAQRLLDAPPTAEPFLETLHALERGYHTVDHGARPLGVHVSSLQDAWGQISGRVFVLEDLTERRVLETQVRRMDRLASVGQLASGIAHEIRNPLAILRATSQMLAERLRADAALASYLDILITESDRMDRLISELQDYARPRPPALDMLDLASILHAAGDEVRPYANQRGVEVVVDTSEGVAVSADPQQLHQLLINLLLNAIQASPDGGVVRLIGEHTAHGPRIAVEDAGCGMSPEVQERVCDPFFTTRDEGTGLGLAIVAAVVQQHQGTLQFHSVVGQGTRVSVLLPTERSVAWRAC